MTEKRLPVLIIVKARLSQKNQQCFKLGSYHDLQVRNLCNYTHRTKTDTFYFIQFYFLKNMDD